MIRPLIKPIDFRPYKYSILIYSISISVSKRYSTLTTRRESQATMEVYDCAPYMLKSNSITLSSFRSSSRAGSRAGMRPASELDSVMGFGLSCAILLASRSQTSCEPVCDHRFELSRYVEITRTCLLRKPGLRPAR